MKKIHFEAKRPSQSGTGTIDDWVLHRASVQRERTKRLTIDVTVSLHTRIKSRCALENLIMADVIRDLLEREFPEFSAEPILEK